MKSSAVGSSTVENLEGMVRGLVEFPVRIDKPERDGIDRDEDILAKAVELLGIRPGCPTSGRRSCCHARDR